MTDIVYRWRSEKGVGLSSDLSLPSFAVVGHRQMEKRIQLSTGEHEERV